MDSEQVPGVSPSLLTLMNGILNVLRVYQRIATYKQRLEVVKEISSITFPDSFDRRAEGQTADKRSSHVRDGEF